MNFRHILVPTDFGRASRRATRLALDLANATDADVTLLHAYRLPEYAYGIVPTIELTKLRETAGKALDEEVARFGGACPLSALLLHDAAGAAIANAAKERNADLIVMGTHGHRGMKHMLLGSVAERTLRSSTIPVLTVPHASFANRAEAGRRLGEAVQDLRSERPTVIALSRGGLAVGAGVAHGLGCLQDVLCVAPVRGPSGSIAGAVAEDGTFAPDAIANARVGTDVSQMADAISRTRVRLADAALDLRGSRWVIDVMDRAVVLVADALEEASCVAAAATVLRRMGARLIIAAVPVCTEEQRVQLAASVNRVAVVETLEAANDAVNVYRDARELSSELARRLLGSGAHEIG